MPGCAWAIAGVLARVRAGDSLVLPRQDDVFAPFLCPGASPGALSTIDVEVVFGPPAVPPGPVLFESGAAWTAREDEMGYRLVVGSGSEAARVLRCNADTSRVLAHVSGPAGGSAGADAGAVDDPVRFPLDQLVVMAHLATRGGVVVHSAGAVIDGAGLVFPGVSTAGKTTLCRELIGAGLGDGLLSDDRTIVRVAKGEGAGGHLGGGGSVLWGTPWPGDAQVARNASAPLRALMFLVKDDADGLAPLEPPEVARRLMAVVSCPWYDRRLVPHVLDTCGALAEQVPGYELHFRRGGRVAELLRRFAAGLVLR